MSLVEMSPHQPATVPRRKGVLSTRTCSTLAPRRYDYSTYIPCTGIPCRMPDDWKMRARHDNIIITIFVFIPTHSSDVGQGRYNFSSRPPRIPLFKRKIISTWETYCVPYCFVSYTCVISLYTGQVKRHFRLPAMNITVVNEFYTARACALTLPRRIDIDAIFPSVAGGGVEMRPRGWRGSGDFTAGEVAGVATVQPRRGLTVERASENNNTCTYHVMLCTYTIFRIRFFNLIRNCHSDVYYCLRTLTDIQDGENAIKYL